MKKYLLTYARNFDYGLFLTYIILVLFGLVMIYSASMMIAVTKNFEPDYFYTSQLRSILISLVAFLCAAFIPYKHFSNKKLMATLMFVMLGLLLWVYFGGLDINGAKSWINLGFMTFQPSEFAKLFVIVYLAGSFYRKSLKEESIQFVKPSDITYPILIWLLIIFAVAMETDLGAVAIIGVIALSVVCLSGIRGKSLAKFFSILSVFGGIVVIFAAIIKWDSITNESRMGRIQVLGNPFEYAQGAGYQLVNGFLAIGGGGLQGRGLGQGIQKLGYLPEPQTDFISAVIAEELGIFGIGIVIFGLGFIVLRSFYIAMTTSDPLARMIAGGIGAWIGFQTVVNLGGVTGLIPLTGVTLPFISHGGSSILLLSVAMGILINISMFYKRDKRKV